MVFSRDLGAVSTTMTHLLRELDPLRIQRMKDELVTDMLSGVANLAFCTLAAGLVDEVQLF